MLYLVRHGPVNTNYQDRFLGDLDVSLTTEKEMQARLRHELAITIVKLPVHDNVEVISSPLRRCLQTAELLDYSVNAIDPRIQEFDLGKFKGLQKTPEIMERVYTTELHPDSNTHNGETFNTFKERVKRALVEYLDLAQDRDVIIFTHSGVIRLIATKILDLSYARDWVPDYLDVICINPVENLMEQECNSELQSKFMDNLFTGLLQ